MQWCVSGFIIFLRKAELMNVCSLVCFRTLAAKRALPCVVCTLKVSLV